MLTSQTYSVISSLKDISNDMIFTYPTMGISDANKTVMAYLDLKGLGNEDFEEFGIMDVKQYLDLLNIAGKDATVTNNGGILNIKSPTIGCKFATTNIAVLEAKNCRPVMAIPTNFSNAEKVFEFALSSEDMDKIKKVSSLLNFSEVVISKEDDKIVVKVDNETEKHSSNDFKIYLDGECTNDTIKVVLGVSNVKKLPQGNYIVTGAVNPKNPSNVLVRFESENVEGLQFYIATRALQK